MVHKIPIIINNIWIETVLFSMVDFPQLCSGCFSGIFCEMKDCCFITNILRPFKATNAISSIYLTHPFKNFTKPEAFWGCKVRQKQFVNTITFFLPVHVIYSLYTIRKKVLKQKLSYKEDIWTGCHPKMCRCI